MLQHDNKPMKWHGIEFFVQELGMCSWREVKLKSLCEIELYRLERDPDILSFISDNHLPRKEYFFGQLMRVYLGKQNCFLEFCESLSEIDSPSRKDFYAAAEKLFLDEKTKRLYIQMHHKIFSYGDLSKQLKPS